MNAHIKENWVAALESGDYEQGVSLLAYEDGESMKYCCLGVLCELAVEAGVAIKRKVGNTVTYGDNEYDATLPPVVMFWAGIEQEEGQFTDRLGDNKYLAALNDDGMPFTEIAGIIRERF